MFENYLYATNSDNANMQPKTSVIRINRFNSTDYQVVTRVDKGGALHVYHQRRQPPGAHERSSYHIFYQSLSTTAASHVLFCPPLVFQCAATHVRWISLGRPEAAPTSVSLETDTRPGRAAVVLDLV